MAIWDGLIGGAAASAGVAALLAPGRDPISRAGLVSVARTIGQSLARAGVRRGHVVAMALSDDLDLFLTFCGTIPVAACAPLNSAASRAEFEFALGELRPAALIVDQPDGTAVAVARSMGIRVFESRELRAEHALGDVLESPGDEDLALVLFTSATTDRAKAVPLTHANLAAMAANTRRALALSADDRLLSMMPMFHLQGLLSTLAQLLAGGSAILLGGFEAARFAECLKRDRPTWYTAGPALHGAILAAGPVTAGRLRFVRSIGARMAPALMAEVERALGVPVLEGYGLTETGLVTSNQCPPGLRKPGSAGRSCGAEIAVLDERRRCLDAGQDGEIAVRGPSVMSGYREDEAATRQAFHDGWFLTGDVGHMDEDGFLFITGRLKEMINRGGEKVLPGEVEEALMAHPAVWKAAVFGRPHPTLGEDVAAAVVLRAGARVSEWALRGVAAGQLAACKVPRRIFFVDSIPLGATGKVRRSELATQLAERTAPYVEPRSDAEQTIAGIWRRVLHVERAGVHDDFFDLGGDSFAVTLMMAEFESEFGAAAGGVDLSSFFETPNIETLAGLLGAKGTLVRTERRAGRHPLLALQRQGAGTPFFCVPGADENPYYFRELAQELGEDRPFYIVRDPRPMEERPAYSVEQHAARLIEQMRAAQPRGPYLLGGHCYGGILSYEMARQLVAGGQRVERLLLFEVPAPGYPKVLRNWRGYGRQAKAVLLGERALELREVRAHAGLLLGLCRKRVAGLAERVPGLAAVAPSPQQAAHPNWRAGRAYRVKPLTCDVVQFVAAEARRSATVLDDPLTAWGAFVRGSFDVMQTAGAADRIFRQPHVRVLARLIRGVLAEATHRR